MIFLFWPFPNCKPALGIPGNAAERNGSKTHRAVPAHADEPAPGIGFFKPLGLFAGFSWGRVLELEV